MKTLKWLTWAGVAVAVAGVVAGSVVFAADSTYPEEFPGWAAVLIWAGAGLAVATALVRGFLAGLRDPR